MRKLRLIHTSDTHLGDPAGHPRADEVLSSVVDAVKRLDGDVLLLAGDVFDNERVSDEVVERFISQMALVDVPVVVLPATMIWPTRHRCTGVDPSSTLPRI